jgi:predicted nuclease of restriction endonuclease-like RecB superfamily
LVPERLLQFAIAGKKALPRYLTEADHPWLRILIEEYQRFEGSKVDQLRERLGEPLPCYVPEGKAKLAMHVLDRMCGSGRPPSPIAPRLARKTLFAEAQRSRRQDAAWDRGRPLAAAASKLGISPTALLESLFADLPAERRVVLPTPSPEPSDLALRANLSLAQGFLQRSSRVTLEVEGNARAVVRQVLLRRLLCAVHSRHQPQAATLEISGPYSLFKRTILYGRALGSLIPVLHTCDRFRLTAEAALRGRDLVVTLRSGDPIFPGLPTPSRYDSQLEERFAREFRRVASDWDLIREPEPLRAGNHLIFPDFAIHHRRDRARCVLLEIVGFWTPRYLRSKLERLRAAGAPNLILCIDEALNCADDALPENAHIIRYKRRIDAAAVLAMVEAMTDSRDSRIQCFML